MKVKHPWRKFAACTTPAAYSSQRRYLEKGIALAEKAAKKNQSTGESNNEQSK